MHTPQLHRCESLARNDFFGFKALYFGTICSALSCDPCIFFSFLQITVEISSDLCNEVGAVAGTYRLAVDRDPPREFKCCTLLSHARQEGRGAPASRKETKSAHWYDCDTRSLR